MDRKRKKKKAIKVEKLAPNMFCVWRLKRRESDVWPITSHQMKLPCSCSHCSYCHTHSILLIIILILKFETQMTRQDRSISTIFLSFLPSWEGKPVSKNYVNIFSILSYNKNIFFKFIDQLMNLINNTV
jgi:hypothetical protein